MWRCAATAMVAIKREAQLGYYQFQARGADIHSVGAGGGSIAYLNLAGALKVGPRSAGADPGPGLLRPRRRRSRR